MARKKKVVKIIIWVVVAILVLLAAMALPTVG